MEFVVMFSLFADAAKRGFLNLTNAFTSNTELRANLFERMWLVLLEAMALNDDFAIAVFLKYS